MKSGDVVLLRFPRSGLTAGKVRFVLVSVEEVVVTARLGEISPERLCCIKRRLADWLKK